MPSGRRSMRAQLLMNAITGAQMAAANNDYLNAVTLMRAAGASADYKLPPKPFGVPDIIYSEAWKRYRAYYHDNFETVHMHVNDVLKALANSGVEVESDEGQED